VNVLDPLDGVSAAAAAGVERVSTASGLWRDGQAARVEQLAVLAAMTRDRLPCVANGTNTGL